MYPAVLDVTAHTLDSTLMSLQWLTLEAQGTEQQIWKAAQVAMQESAPTVKRWAAVLI